MSNSTAEPSAFCTLVHAGGVQPRGHRVEHGQPLVDGRLGQQPRDQSLRALLQHPGRLTGARIADDVPFTGSGVSRVMPASASAFELTQAVW